RRLASEGVLDDLYAKAMVIQQAGGDRAVLLNADLLFFRAPTAAELTKRIEKKTGLRREQILLNGSHTHSGPVWGVKDPERFDLPPDRRKVVDAYTEKTLNQMVDLVAKALADMKPARLCWGVGKADFVMNRRLMSADGKCRGMGPNPKGPADRNVPVLRVDDPQGRMRAVVFGCACHNVTLGGKNHKISGDYAGWAQKCIEEKHPGAQAMFVIGCGADTNSHPRGGADEEKLVQRHGRSLADEVSRVAGGKLNPVSGPLRISFKWTDLPLECGYTHAQLDKMAKTGAYWHSRNAKELLKLLDDNQPLPEHYKAAVTVWQFGDDLTLVALPGEAVSEYVSLIEKALGPNRLWVASFCNESFGYLPTAKMTTEGGHETIGLTLDVGFFSPRVEGVVVNTVKELAAKAGRGNVECRNQNEE
ncbi:MAG: neutral/alkaline non-lysosomal ceramidase N-terminal domain-containing protein, partial [Planctomycetota bacterium]|nr:neutral/alkaline non-lysosomal ceramidase N-terminal domain-containing protein [Planctomycetota bacterium]